MKILFDESHGEPTLEELYTSFTKTMKELGSEVEVLKSAPLTGEALGAGDVFMTSFPQDPFSAEEINTIKSFVEGGGGLFVVGEEGNWEGFKEKINTLSKEFGIEFNDDEVHDPTDSISESYSRIHTLKEHPISEGVKDFMIYGGCSLKISGNAQAVATGDDDTFSTHGYYKEGEYPPVLAAAEYGSGRVVCIGDGSLFRDNFIDQYNNRKLAINIISWLGESAGKKKEEEAAAAPEKDIKTEILDAIGDLEKKYGELDKLKAEGKISEDDYNSKVTEYGAQLDELEKMLKEVS